MSPFLTPLLCRVVNAQCPQTLLVVTVEVYSVDLMIFLLARLTFSLLFPDRILSAQQHHGFSAVLRHLLQVSVMAFESVAAARAGF